MPLLEFITKVTPRFRAPTHLEPVIRRLVAAARPGAKPLRLVICVPPRHGKTELLLHFIAWLLLAIPALQIAYIGYATKWTENKSRKARSLAQIAGVPLDPSQKARGNWRTGIAEGGVWATGMGGPLTGEGFNWMFVDDPVKSRKEAESPVLRAQHWEWFNDTAYTRLEPRAHCIVNHTRWHEDDLAGRLIAAGWDAEVLPAINERGEALCPWRYTLEQLREIEQQLGAYGWESLYQGRPRPRGSKLFVDAHYYKQLPSVYRVGIGVDCAYSSKTSADWSVAVVLAEAMWDDGEPMYFVLDVRREQCSSPAWARVLNTLQLAWPGAPMLWYGSGTESGVADHLVQEGATELQFEPATADKFIRAQPVSAKWNRKRVLLPEHVPWLLPFLGVVLGFTGVKDKHDDDVDALAAAHDVLARPPAPRGVGDRPVFAF